jgi:hypothetical protein
MANTFKSYQSTSVTTETTVLTGPSATQTTIIGMSLCNTSGVTAVVDVKLNSAHLAKAVTIPHKSSLIIVGGDQKIVVEDGDTIKVTSNQIVDSIISVLEIT